MQPIYIPQLLKAPEKTQKIQVEDFLCDLETLTPVRGWLNISHGGNYLELTTKVETIVTISCDRCLQQYNHRLSVDTTELIWLDEEQPMEPLKEQEIKFDDLSETLHPRSYFQPEVWLYEQICLALPMRQLCDQNCEGVLTKNLSTTPQIDSRWSSLESLKNQLQN